MKSENLLPDKEVIWGCVEDGFYVASLNNVFLGFVDRIEDTIFYVFDNQSQQVGLFKTLEEAQKCLLSHSQTNSVNTSGNN